MKQALSQSKPAFPFFATYLKTFWGRQTPLFMWVEGNEETPEDDTRQLTGENQNQPFQLSFNASLVIYFLGSRVTYDGGLILVG